jgi:hypothetical protein
MEIIAVYCENHAKSINTLCGENSVFNVKANTIPKVFKEASMMLNDNEVAGLFSHEEI